MPAVEKKAPGIAAAAGHQILAQAFAVPRLQRRTLDEFGIGMGIAGECGEEDAAFPRRLGDVLYETKQRRTSDNDRKYFLLGDPAMMLGVPELTGSPNLIVVPDPATFRVLPWDDAPGRSVGWVLCDAYFGNGKPFPFCPRQLLLKDVIFDKQVYLNLKLEYNYFSSFQIFDA